MFHIARIKEEHGLIHLKLEGELDRLHVVALRDVADEGLRRGIRSFVLDCHDLRAADDDGVMFLVRLKSLGASFVSLPLPLQWKMSHYESQTSQTP